MLDAAADMNVPGAPNKKRALARTSCVALSPTGRCWAAATTEGVVMYSLDDDMVGAVDLTGQCSPFA
jgi:periodic tryptophan protein 2